ncbi:MAG: hypothetical protein LRS49_02215 [Desulfurococcales archaeon]|nr:hypothetical protein [Desulfurococcales archaeon]
MAVKAPRPGPRPHRGPRDRGGRHPRGRGEPRPRPIGDRCNPLCPFFRCLKNALMVRTEYYRGRPIKVPMCSWIGDRCIGAQCRYAHCEKHAMLPDGRCAFAVQGKRRMRDFEEELKAKDELDELEEEF